MRDLFENLLIHEVVTIAGARRPNVQKWIDNGLVAAPPVVGKHRRFSARHTVQVLLMTELNNLGVKPSAASGWLSQLAGPLLNYVDECVVRNEQGRITLTQDCVLRLWLAPGGRIINVEQLDDVVRTAGLPQYSLILRCGPVFAAAIRRAEAVREAREARA